MSLESIGTASDIYFTLLRNKMIDRDDDKIKPYLEDASIRETVNVLARKSGTQILEGVASVQMVVLPEGSLYATSFTHLRERFSSFQNKTEFNLVRFILMIYIAEIDSSLLTRSLAETDGMSFEKLVLTVDETFQALDENLNENTEKNWGIPIKQLMELWYLKDPKEDGKENFNPSTKTKQGLVLYAMRLLESEKVLRLFKEDEEYIIFPKEELYDRIEQIFHHSERFQHIKQLVKEIRKEGPHASN
jgi:hypothetical protein